MRYRRLRNPVLATSKDRCLQVLSHVHYERILPPVRLGELLTRMKIVNDNYAANNAAWDDLTLDIAFNRPLTRRGYA